MSKMREKRIAYMQKALTEDQMKYPNRPISEFAELVELIGDQFNDKYNYKPKGV